MREIIFRGKSKKSGEWVFGWYLKAPFDSWPLRDAIVPVDRAEDGEFLRIEVDPETVGQFTGLTDMEGHKVFEGDIIANVDLDGNACYGVVSYGRYNFPSDEDENSIGFYVNWQLNFYYRRDLGYWIENRRIAVIGNIYDNPDLLEV